MANRFFGFLNLFHKERFSMNNYTIKAAALSLPLALANPLENAKRQIEAAKKAISDGCNLILFPKMSLTGCSCGNLFYSHRLQKKTEEAILLLKEESKALDAVLVTGFGNGESFKTLAFYKGESFTDFTSPMLPFYFMVKNGNCQDAIFKDISCILYPDARSFTADFKRKLLLELKELSQNSKCPIIYANAGPSESTGNQVFSGLCVIAKDGEIAACSKILQREGCYISWNLNEEIKNPVITKKPYEFKDCNPFIPIEDEEEYCSDILEAQATALAERLERAHTKKAIIGISGGSDSTLAVLAAAKAMELLKRPSIDVLAVTMPGFGTSNRTLKNAYAMMEALGCEIREISIKESVLQHFKDINHNPDNKNVTYENAQARERTQILMDLANRDDGLVVGTGDISEAALGWCTYNGDHMAMYSVNCGLTKGLVKKTIEVVAKRLRKGNSPFSEDKDALKLAACLEDVLDTPVSPELLPADENGKISQITEDKVGPYALHDFFLYNFVVNNLDPIEILDKAKLAFCNIYDEDTIKKWLKTFLRRFFTQQFKRNCSPEGPQLVQISLSPRGAWDMPSDVDYNAWIEGL